MLELKGFDLLDQWFHFLRILRSRAWTILTFLTLTSLVVFIGSSLQTALYRATATVLIDMESPSLLAVSTTRDDSTVGQTNYLTYADYYRTQLEIIRGRTIGERVFANLKLAEQDRYRGKKDPVGSLIDQVKIEPVKQTRLAKISVDDPSSKLAARLANEFALVFVEENLARAAAAEAMTLMKNEYLKLQSKEAELSKRYKAKFPSVARVRQQMEQLAGAIEQEMKRQLHYERHQAEGGEAGPTDTRKLFLERLGKNSMMSGLRPNNIRLQDLAQAPTRPYKPNLKLNLLLALFLGLLGGIGAGIVEELLDASVKVPEDIDRDPQLVLLGHVPRMDGISESSNGLLHRYQYVLSGPHSAAAEAYRALRTNLIYAAPQSSSSMLVVTSPGSEEGKTTTVANLGIVLSQIGLKVLLVDADLRRPKLHEAFHLKQQPGLSEFLIGKASLDNIIQPTTIPGVWVIPSGKTPPNPSELLALPQMKDFLTQVNGKFDRVLFDTPPVIAVTDAVILAAMARAVIIVAQSEKTPRRALSRLTAIVSDVHAKVLGIVLNNVSSSYVPVYYGYSPSYKGYVYGSPAENGGKNPQKENTLNRFARFLNQLKSRIDYSRPGQKGRWRSPTAQRDEKT